MAAQTCCGREAATGEVLEVGFGAAIEWVRPSTRATDVYLAPGWIDIQVNGFAGVDYNDPTTPAEAIGRSIHALFGTGVTRFYPTVITGAAEEMAASLRNLSRAK